MTGYLGIGVDQAQRLGELLSRTEIEAIAVRYYEVAQLREIAEALKEGKDIRITHAPAKEERR